MNEIVGTTELYPITRHARKQLGTRWPDTILKPKRFDQYEVPRSARAREKLLTEILTDGEYLKERLETQFRGIQLRLAAKRAELKSTSKDAARQVIQNLALLRLGEKKLSRDQRSRLFHALVRRVVPENMELTQIEIELFVQPRAEPSDVGRSDSIGQRAPQLAAVPIRLPIETQQTVL